MVSPPTPTVRRALAAAAWLTVTFAGLIAAVWAVGWAIDGGTQPSAASVGEAVHLDFPGGTEILDADLTEVQTPAPGARAEVTADIPADAFADFLDANAMDAPLPTGTTPAGTTSGIIPAGCTPEVCYGATIVIADDHVTVRLTVTLL
jgi:hypothetical protein